MASLLGVVELLDLARALATGEQSVASLAERFGICERTVVRHRARARTRGG